MKFAFIEQHCRCWPIALLCRVLGVSHRGFHAWRQRAQYDTSPGRPSGPTDPIARRPNEPFDG